MPPPAPLDPALVARFKLPVRSFDAGEKIFLEDDTGAHMYLVLSGRVSILSYGTVLENVEAQGTFGEMALIEDAPRSATAIALEPTEVAVVDKAAFLDLVRQEPGFSLYVMRLLAGRLRRMNETL